MEPTTSWSIESFQKHGKLVLELLAQLVERGRRGEGPVVRLASIETLTSELGLHRVVAGEKISEKELVEFLHRFLDGATNLQHPSYMAHQVALPHYGSALADLISGTLNNGMSVYEMGPTAGAIETAVIDWMLDKIGWPPSGQNRANLPEPSERAGGGVLTHGGSLANLTALLAARARVVPEAWEEGVSRDLVVVAPENAHYSLSRATAILGLGTRSLLAAPCDDLGRVTPESLEQLLTSLSASGRRVLAVCANACATATGLFDDLQAVAEVCRRLGVWFHVDGAHGASALLHPQEAKLLRGVELADSLVWDAHKLLQVSTLCAAVLVRDGRDLPGAFRQDAVYVTEGKREIGHDFIEHQFECTKAPLGLKLALTLALIGEEGLASNIEILWENTRSFHQQISRRPGFEVLCPPESNILCFRYQGDDALQTRIKNALMAEGDFLVSQADVGGRRWLRLTVMNALTDGGTISRLLDRIEELAR